MLNYNEIEMLLFFCAVGLAFTSWLPNHKKEKVFFSVCARHTNDARIPFSPPAAMSCQQTEVLEKCINDDFTKFLLTENARQFFLFFLYKIFPGFLFANQLKKILKHLQLHEIFIYI